ncbi:hypothetical protein T01_7895 [Trichinella spiralis]|uniref:Uncharacterized protein n=1 Tax=Trichinella spiralis TaxID=6334 RepID=A0A0V1BJB1_TRISP|nr:hypothetical protein T01_7895 [Trichinella spiralis]
MLNDLLDRDEVLFQKEKTMTSFYDSLRQIGKLEKEGGMDGEGSTSHQGSDLIIIITTIPILILEQHCRQLLLLVLCTLADRTGKSPSLLKSYF